MHHFNSSFTPEGPNEKSIPALLWDTAGHERFRSITQSFYKNANAVILVFDVCQRKTFDSVQYWLQSIRDHGQQNTILTLVGNKVDNEDNRAVKREEGQKMATENDMLYFETSARTGLNI